MSYSPIIKSIITSIKSTKRATTDNNARAIIPAAIPANMLMLSPLSRCTLAPTLSIQTLAIFAVLALEEGIRLQTIIRSHQSIGVQNRIRSCCHLCLIHFDLNQRAVIKSLFIHCVIIKNSVQDIAFPVVVVCYAALATFRHFKAWQE